MEERLGQDGSPYNITGPPAHSDVVSHWPHVFGARMFVLTAWLGLSVGLDRAVARCHCCERARSTATPNEHTEKNAARLLGWYSQFKIIGRRLDRRPACCRLVRYLFLRVPRLPDFLHFPIFFYFFLYANVGYLVLLAV